MRLRGHIFKVSRLVAVVVAIMMAATTAWAAGPEAAELDMTVAENIATPVIPERQKRNLTGHIDQLRRSLRAEGLDAKAVRQGEVLQVTIPCHALFAPNATELTDEGIKLLSRFRPLIVRPDHYKIIVTVHTDDTGDDVYADRITELRATAIDDYFYRLNSDRDTYVIPYGMGRDEPIAPYNSILHRRANRRAEIYIVPTAVLARDL